MKDQIEIGSTVRANKIFRATLSAADRKAESRRRYRVVDLRTMGDTTLVDTVNRRNQQWGFTLGDLELA